MFESKLTSGSSGKLRWLVLWHSQLIKDVSNPLAVPFGNVFKRQQRDTPLIVINLCTHQLQKETPSKLSQIFNTHQLANIDISLRMLQLGLQGFRLIRIHSIFTHSI